MNILILWDKAQEMGYQSPNWFGYDTAQQLGGQVQKDEHATHIIWAGPITKTEQDDDGEEKQIRFFRPKVLRVFNAEQIKGLPEHYYHKPEAKLTPVERIEHAEQFFNNTGADIRTGGNRAYYSAGTDHIQMPPIELFKDADSYYRTLAHESAHWTKHDKRLNRSFGRKKWGDEGYAKEEMAAELCAAYIGADLELAPAENQHAAYLDSWQHAITSDKYFLATAASHAQKAAEYLHSLQPGYSKTVDEDKAQPESFASRVMESRGMELSR